MIVEPYTKRKEGLYGCSPHQSTTKTLSLSLTSYTVPGKPEVHQEIMLNNSFTINNNYTKSYIYKAKFTGLEFDLPCLLVKNNTVFSLPVLMLEVN